MDSKEEGGIPVGIPPPAGAVEGAAAGFASTISTHGSDCNSINSSAVTSLYVVSSVS